MKLIKYLLVILIFAVFFSCSLNRYSPEIKNTLESAEDNKSDLKKAIRYFEVKGDSLQLDAVLFLIENLPYHSFVEIVPCDSERVEIPWNISKYENYSEARTALDSLEKIGGFDWEANQRFKDAQVISSEFLIQNVEDSFYAWKNLPWSKGYSYEVFVEYILPYRGSNEPLPEKNNWREEFMEKYSELPQIMLDQTDPLEAATFINQELREWFKFDEIYYLHPTDQSIDEMKNTCMGRCEDMTNLAMAVLRANGIAVTSDYTPHWADSGNNHAWNAIVTHEGEAIPFMGCEADPGKYSIRSRVAKVYRKTFAKQDDNLASLLKENEDAPAWLSSKHYVDVTNKYSKVTDLSLKIIRSIPDSVRFAYLCVFNSGEWRAIQWSKIDNKNSTFEDMGIDLCYLPMILEKEIDRSKI